MTTHLPYWLAALYLQDFGPRTFMRALSAFKAMHAEAEIDSFFKAEDNIYQVIGLNSHQIKALRAPDWQAVERDLAWSEQSQHAILALSDDRYPPLLKEITDPPLALYVWGDSLALSKKQIALVGSRQATPAGLKHAEYFAAQLVESGYAITSGLALGIDAAAHRGALSAKGCTLAVMGAGLAVIYPRSHEALAEKIVSEKGAVLSEFPRLSPPKASHFPRRNRIISGLSVGVLVIEAALKSGSLITARHAVEQGREVFALPGSIHQPLAKGCHYLIRQGAKLVEEVGDVLEELGSLSAIITPVKSKPTSLLEKVSSEEAALLTIIGHEITPVDVIILHSRLAMSKVSSLLLTLELKGYIQSVKGGYVRIIS